MRLKEGVDLTDVSWRMFHAALVAETVYRKFGAEAVITSGREGKHRQGSLHYKGLALDFRTSNVRHPIEVIAALKQALGPDYDAVLEPDHVHVEYDPA